MTSKEFCIWLKGFTEGVHDFNITPKQWDLLKEKLSEVSDQQFPFGTVTIANPYIASFGDISTSTSTSLPSGSTISYTTSNDKTLLND
jgi:hypothetical protein